MKNVSKVLLCTLFSLIIIQKIQAQFTAINNGNWNASATWQGGVVPSAGADVIIAANVSIDVTNVTVGNLTINTGFTLTGVYTNSITMNSGKTLTNNGTLTGTLGSLYTFIFSGSGLVAGSSATNFSTVQINGAVDFGTTSSVANLTINAGGSVNTNRPTYRIGSSLNYNTGGTYVIGDEWVTGNTNYPRALTINAGTTLSFGNITTSRRVGGVNDAMNINGGMILSSQVGGDLIITSTYNNFNGTFNANGRTVTCLDGGSNCIVGGSQPVSFDNLVLNLPGKQFNLFTPVTVTTSATFTAGYTQLNAHDLIFNSGATITGASANCYVYTTGTGRLVMKGVGTGSVVAPIGRNIGNVFIHYNPITITNGGGFDYAIKANATAPTGAGILNVTKVIRCQWDITPSGNAANVDLKFQYIAGQGVSGGTFSETAPQRGLLYNTGTSAWETIGTATPVGTNPYNVSYTFSGPNWGLFSFESVTPPPQPPTITSFSPTTGPVGTTVTITGTNFNTTVANNIVFFGATKATVTAASATSLIVTVPLGATYESISVINSSTGLQVASGGKFSPTITTPKSILPATDFEPIKDLGSNGQQAIATQLADIDGDGKLDVINGLQNGNMSVRRNTSTVGNISLASPVFLNGTSNGFIIAKVADMDGDGKLDIIGVSNADNFIRVYINNSTPGTISFSSQKTFFIATTSGALNNLEVADFDNDGKPDMVIVDGWGTSASMFRNTSTGTGTANLTFATSLSVPGLATGENINSTYAGDVDGDGKMDLVISYCTVSAPTIIAVLKNQSTAGTFSFAAPVNLVHGTSSVQCGRLLKFADINGDGKLDILSINNQDNSLHYFVNTTTASISFATYQSIATIDNAQSFDMGDVNGDGKIDMVIQNATNYSGIQGNDQMLMANSTTAGNVSFVRSDIQQNLNSTTGSPNNYWRINLGDLDGDGKMDLYIASSNYPTSKSFAIRYNQQPTSVTATGTLTAFTGCSGTASASQSFIVSGSTLTANLVVTAPTGYEVSTTAGSGYTSSVSLTPVSGNVASTTIYARLSAAATGSPAGNIAVASTGATTQNIAVTGTVNPLPTATITAGGATTFCQGGSVTLTASTGSSYLWSNGATTQAITVSASGSYTVAVTNASNCSAISAVTVVTVNPLPTATITAGGATTFCAGGSVVLTASTGSSYLWSNGATTQAITVTTAGSYTVKVTNTNGCFTTSAATVVTVNPLPTATITASGPLAFCAGGSVVLTASTGSSYLWSNGATTQAITVTTAGSYTVTVTNASGCSAISVATAVTINPASVATITTSGSTTFCQGGSVTLTTSPGVSYLWSTGSTAASINVTTAGSYTVTVTNVTGCSATSAAAVVTVNPLPVASISSTGTVLCGTGATLNLTATGGSSYQWGNGGTPISGATTATYTANAIGTYTAKATSALGCTAPASGSITLTQQVMPVPAYTYDSYCINKAIAFTNQSTVLGSGAVTYTWSDNVGNTTSTTNTNFTYATAGNYSVKLKVQSNLCTNLRDSITKVIPVEVPQAAIRYNTVDVAVNDNIQLQARSFGNKFTWSPSTGLSNLFISNPRATLTQQQEYRVAIGVPSGCTTVDTILVRVQETNTVYVPNVFTPNGDGRNDKVIIIPVGITQLKSFRIYNRWNKKVFETSDINGGWDGKVNGVLQPMDTYVWVVEAIAKDGNLIAKSGSITLLR